MKTFLKTIILPKLDYGSIVWAPIKVQDLRKIEKVQSNFTKRIQGLEDLDYWQRLKYLKLYSIERRFERYAVIYIWKIINKLVVNPGIEINDDFGSRTGLTVKVPKYSIQLREQSFFIKGPQLFNSLPVNVKEFPIMNENNSKLAIDAFKKKLDT